VPTPVLASSSGQARAEMPHLLAGEIWRLCVYGVVMVYVSDSMSAFGDWLYLIRHCVLYAQVSALRTMVIRTAMHSTVTSRTA
jgi:hypothetical protein